MNDDRLTELMLRASAYLDGELDADETALAEADPELMAEVEQLRALQVEVRDVEPPAAAARESAIAAALAEFDAIHADVVDAPPSQVVPFRPRPSYTRWLTAAAAFVAVGLVGVVASQGLGGGDDDGAAFESADLRDATADRAEAAEALPSIAADAAADAAADEGMAATELEAPPADEPVMDATTMAEMESAPTGAPGSGDGGGTAAIPPVEGPVTPESLFAVGQELLGLFEAGQLITPNTACEIEGFEVLSASLYDTGAELRDVIIAADRATGEVGAFDAATCENVAVVTGP